MGSPLIIGLSGKKQSGKDTVCSAIFMNLHGYMMDSFVSVYSFADMLKQNICKDVLGLTEEQINGTDEQKNSNTIYRWENFPDTIRYVNAIETEQIRKGGTIDQFQTLPVLRTGFMTSREIMQVVGTDIFRDYFDDDIWVNAVFRRIKEGDRKVVIISDVRFPGEVDRIISEGGYIIRLLRDVGIKDCHSSEGALDNYDFVSWGNRVSLIDNQNMSIEEQNNVAINYVKSLLP